MCGVRRKYEETELSLLAPNLSPLSKKSIQDTNAISLRLGVLGRGKRPEVVVLADLLARPYIPYFMETNESLGKKLRILTQ